MLGVGTWACTVDTMFFKGDVSFVIGYENNEYSFDIKMDMTLPEYKITKIETEGNTLKAKCAVDMLPGKEIDADLTFDGDKFDGVLKIPFLGKIKTKDGHKVA